MNNRFRRSINSLLLLSALTLITLAFGAWALHSETSASSHREAPLISGDPQVDNTDVYAFRDPVDPSKVTLISNWIPFEEPAGGPNFYHFEGGSNPVDFDSAPALYRINIDRDGDGIPDIYYEWAFSEVIQNPNTFLYNTGPLSTLNDPDYNYRQYYSLREVVFPGPTTTVLVSNALMVPDNIGPRSEPNYAALAAQGVRNFSANGFAYKEFTGQRDDPFFADVASIFDLLGLRPFNAAHIIPLTKGPGVDTLGGFNIHTTAIQVPISRLAPTCTNNPTDRKCVIGVWSTAYRRTMTIRTKGTETSTGALVQVSRLGHPLVNEVVMSLALKDAFNSVDPTADSTLPVVLNRVSDPELPKLINLLYGIPVPPTPRNDLVAVFLTGFNLPGFTLKQTGSDAKQSEQLRLNVAVPPHDGPCGGHVMGVLGGDLAGYPNGRRLNDDVVDIALQAVAGGYALTPAFNHSPNNKLGDGVGKNDFACLPRFPYMASPSQGYFHHHHQEGSSITQ